MRFIPQSVVDTCRYIALGAEPLQHGLIILLVPGGKTACMEIDRQTIAVPAAIRRNVEIKFIRCALPIGQIRIDCSYAFIPFYCILPVKRVSGHFHYHRGEKSGKEYHNIDESPHNSPFFLCFTFAHRKFPPNSVPPTNRLRKARTTNRPKTAATIMTTSRMISLFCSNVMISFLPFLDFPIFM